MVKKLTQMQKNQKFTAAAKAGDLETMKKIYASGDVPEYTGEALAEACCRGGPDMVRFLLENGASFDHGDTSESSAKHGGPAHLEWYQKFPVAEQSDRRADFASPLSDKERTETLRLLDTFGCRHGFPELLFNAITLVDRAAAETLLDLGRGVLPDGVPAILADATGESPELPDTAPRLRDRVESALIRAETSEQIAWMIRTFMRCDNVVKIAFGNRSLYSNGVFQDHFCSEELFPICLAHTNLAEEADRQDMLKALVRSGNVVGLGIALERGWCRSSLEASDLITIARARDDKAPEVAAALVDYAGKQKWAADTAFTMDPFAEEVVRRSWTMASADDGRLELVAYKGDATDVVIPSRVGDREVAGIRRGAFDPSVRNLRPEMTKVRANLTSVVFPGSIKTIPTGVLHALDTESIAAGSAPVSRYPAQLQSLTLQDGVETIDRFAFRGLSELFEAELPESIRDIRDEAFAYCRKLKDVRLPSGLQSLGSGAFLNTGISRVSIPGLKHGIPDGAFQDCASLEECEISDGVQSVGDEAFRGCRKLQKVKLPASLETIGKDAFRDCSSLKTVEFPEGLRTIGSFAFSNTGIERIVIPKSVTSVDTHAFYNCRRLKVACFLGSETVIAPYIFAGCPELCWADGSSFDTIPEGAFFECDTLGGFDWGEQLREIGRYAFYSTNLRSAMLPASVKQIGDHAFGDCCYLTKLSVPKNAAIGTGAFNGCTAFDYRAQILVHGKLYSSHSDYSARLSSSHTAISSYQDDCLPHYIGARVTRIPAGAQLDGEYPEQDIMFWEEPRPKRDLPCKVELVPGNTVEFGTFPQTAEMRLAPIVWDVVRVKRTKVLLVSRMILMYVDRYRFGQSSYYANAMRWEDSRIRLIVNEGFVKSAFTETEKRHIVPVKRGKYGPRDHVFLLSTKQVRKHLSEDQRKTEFTDYAGTQCPDAGGPGAAVWLTRTPAKYGFEGVHFASGAFREGKEHMSGGIRPALWLKMPE